MSKAQQLLDQLRREPPESLDYDKLADALAKEIDFLELRGAMAPQGTVKDMQVSPPGAAEASERLKQHEINLRNPDYVPPWNPGKEKGEDLNRAQGFAQVLENKLIKPEVRLWLENLAKEN